MRNLWSVIYYFCGILEMFFYMIVWEIQVDEAYYVQHLASIITEYVMVGSFIETAGKARGWRNTNERFYEPQFMSLHPFPRTCTLLQSKT